MYTVAVDIGGTFTDVVVMDDASGETFAGKSLTTPDDLQRGVFDGLVDAAGHVGVDVAQLLGATGRMVHATTQSSNAVFSFTGARTAVLATRGFGDTLLIMRATGRVAGLSVFERHHYRMTQKPRLLVDERDIFEIPVEGEFVAAFDVPQQRRHGSLLVQTKTVEFTVSPLSQNLYRSWRAPGGKTDATKSHQVAIL